MRRLAVLGALLGGMLLAGCTGQGEEFNNAWNSIVAKDYASARAAYQGILDEDPNNPYANLNIGVAYENLGDSAMAAQHYKSAIAHGGDAEIYEVAQDGNVAKRATTVKQVATENLAGLGG